MKSYEKSMDEKTEFIQSDDADFDALRRMAAVVKSAAPACTPLHRIEKTGECSGVIQKIIVPGIGGKNWKCLFGCDTEYAIAYQDIKQIGPDVIMVDVP